MNTSFFGELLQTIAERGRALLDRATGAAMRRRAPKAWSSCASICCPAAARPPASRSPAKSSPATRELTIGPRIAFFEALAQRFGTDQARHGSGRRRVARVAVRRDSRRSACRLRAAPAGTVPPAQSRARRHRRAGAHARAVDRRARPSRRPRAPSTTISSICSRPGSIAASWCCGASTGRRRRSCWKRSSATRRCTRSATGTICAAASIRRTGAATPSSIRRWSTSR